MCINFDVRPFVSSVRSFRSPVCTFVDFSCLKCGGVPIFFVSIFKRGNEQLQFVDTGYNMCQPFFKIQQNNKTVSRVVSDVSTRFESFLTVQ